MSTLAYAAKTTERVKLANPTKAATTPGPTTNTYVDALAALVPAEVLTAHAVILSFTTTSASNPTVVKIDPANVATLAGVFYALVFLSTLLYVGGRVRAKSWNSLDWLRMLVPPLAFVGWTMLLKASAFDAIAPAMPMAARNAVAIVGAIALGFATSWLADKAGP